ncbi:hypothetical protein DERF_007267 [Dermatophagoides farinae]|uniref:Secreted protein n=1 Tax=Dermatophagoides farinae TaxID=6954 RepID=A0A922I009_DERFA|nr:hypothetical protein DERF_007267 [Dermatophagoides farinae]
MNLQTTIFCEKFSMAILILLCKKLSTTIVPFINDVPVFEVFIMHDLCIRINDGQPTIDGGHERKNL